MPSRIVSSPFACRHFEDTSKGILYPSSIKLLVIVRKEQEHERWLPFQLRLDWQLFISRPDKRAYGWRFEIKGKCNPEKALPALEDVQAGELKTVGLTLLHNKHKAIVHLEQFEPPWYLLCDACNENRDMDHAKTIFWFEAES